MAPWIAVLEAYLVKALLRSPHFHRGVQRVHKSVHRIRHGIPPEETGGTNIDSPAGRGWLSHFVDELKEQAGRPPSNTTNVKRTTGAASSRPSPSEVNQAGRTPPKQQVETNNQDQSFVSNFLDELKDQFRGSSKNR